MKTLLIAIVLVSISFAVVSCMTQPNSPSTPETPMHDNMSMSAGDVELKSVDKHKEEVKALTEEWNYFESGNFEEH